MKLLYITNGITGPGGLERVLSVKASMLTEQFDYEVHILSLNEEGQQTFFEFSPKIIRHSITVGGNPIWYIKSYKNGIQQKVREIKPDVISVCDDGLKGFFLPHLIKTKAKWIHESHASMLLGDSGKGISISKRVQHQLKQILGKQFSKIVLLTEGNKKEWQLNNLVMIPNPVPFEINQFSKLQNKKIIAVGSYSYNKGYDLLLRIWQQVEKNLPDWELHVYGKGVRENLVYEAEKLALKNIWFYDPVSDIQVHYLQSSIFVLPSRSEGFGMVLIEAMSCGLPVISFDCPHGPADILTDGEDGFLVENGNITNFAQKLELLMSDMNLRMKFSSAGKTTAEKYVPKKIVQQWDGLFKSLLQSNT